MSEWIKVEDRLPEVNGEYLAWNADQMCKGIDRVLFKDGHFLLCSFPECRYDTSEGPYSHWMPLPEKPND